MVFGQRFGALNHFHLTFSSFCWHLLAPSFACGTFRFTLTDQSEFLNFLLVPTGVSVGRVSVGRACIFASPFFPGLCRGVQNKRVLHTQGHATCSAQFNFLSRCFLCLVTESLTTKLLQRLFELLLFRSLTDVAMLTARTADTANFLPAPAHSARTVSSSDGRKHFHSESILCLPGNARFFSVNDFF